MRFCVADLETTGTESTDQVIEIGSYILDGDTPGHEFHALVAPTIPIPPTSQAVHHIDESDLLQAPTWGEVLPRWLNETRDVEAYCAHNAKFEMMFLGEATKPKPWICTYKCALRAWPEAPAFGNQVLRYWIKPEGLQRVRASESHRALPDAYVTAFLLRELLKNHSMETLIAWTADIPMPPKIMFGKHKGKSWDDAPLDYLDWIIKKSDMDEDTKALAAFHKRARKSDAIKDAKNNEGAFQTGPAPAPESKPQTSRADAYMTLAPFAIGLGETVRDLENWWRDEAMRRFEYGILPGTPQYETLLQLCGDKKRKLLENNAAA